MNSEFWKQFEGTPSIDCVKMKHDIQAKIHEETKDMTWEERMAYYNRTGQEFRETGKIPVAGPESLVLREDSPKPESPRRCMDYDQDKKDADGN